VGHENAGNSAGASLASSRFPETIWEGPGPLSGSSSGVSMFTTPMSDKA
jgi:hypothetical protein